MASNEPRQSEDLAPQAASEADESFGAFASGLAHEIKNPLAGIVGVMEILGQEIPQDSASLEVWQDVRKELRRIEDILNDVSVYARPKPLETASANLVETVRRAVERAMESVREKEIEFNFAPGEAVMLASHDPRQIQQAIGILLQNAILAIDRKGTVEIQIQSRGGFAVIAVADRGRGFDPGQIAHVFRPFFPTRRKRTGLELPLAQRAVLAHRGWIEVTSSPAEGTRFSVFLPVAGTSAAEPRRSETHG